MFSLADILRKAFFFRRVWYFTISFYVLIPGHFSFEKRVKSSAISVIYSGFTKIATAPSAVPFSVHCQTVSISTIVFQNLATAAVGY